MIFEIHPRKKSDIFTPTKHLDCNQLWKFKSPSALRMEFRSNSARQLPHSYALSRVINRFMASGSPTKIIETRNLVEEKPNSSASGLWVLWKILRKILIKCPFEPKTVQKSYQHKLYTVQFCNWILQQNEEFCITWSEEKLWVKKRHLNKQNERCWYLNKPGCLYSYYIICIA